ncbi:hypothetical protein FOZ62_004311 [Perkinsus olseni]|uniref:Apple domain-containing protein n=1 Tax=Perkinsus olseni TaxID=32597 RepID=A0A7J6QTK3_PEROL|nr:hypothetical protein FOZ62_004311 [Perkinsus olseni]
MPPLYYLIVVGGIKAAFGQGNDACQQCCSGLKVEAGVLCEVNTKGLVRFADCIWQDMVSAQCFTDCNNCTSMAYEIKQSCLNTSYTEGFHMIGIGACSDEDGNIPSGYYKGTGSSRGGYEVCRGWCLQDISCIAFGWIPWTGNMCIIYTYIRDRPPPPPPPSSSVSSSLTGASNDDDWQWIDGDSDYSRNNKDIVKTVMATTDDTVSTGQQQQHRPYEECWVKVLRRGGGVGADDTVEGRQLWTIRNVITHPAYINALVIIQG